MRIRFQADADLKQTIVSATLRREPSVDFQTAVAANLTGRDDADVLAVAARDNRVLVSHDHRTMPYHFAEFVANNSIAGVIIVSQRLPVNVVVEELVLIWTEQSAEEWVNRIAHLLL